MIDVSDLTEQDLAAVVALTDPQSVAEATGLHVCYLASLVPNPAGPECEAIGCPRCGTPSTTRYRSPYQWCRSCRRENKHERVGRACAVLAAGLRGEEALYHLMDAMGCSEWVARKLLTEARKQMAVAA